jgi:hypothetical protein
MPLSAVFRLSARLLPALAVALLLLCQGPARADGGMWTFDNFPSQKVARQYGFGPDQAWLDHVRKSSLRIAQGCSASFISPTGLVMTNHHCVVECVEQVSSQDHDYVTNGFSAAGIEQEKKCPAFELDQLVEIKDVTADIRAAVGDKTGAEANAALRAAQAKLQQSCGSDPATRCDVVSLYHGGVYDLYHYKRYDDVRLVFAPEFAVGQFGGDPDNFNFPRYDFDIGILRAYENGKPASSPDYLRWSPAGSKAGELVFTSGNPGGTDREFTMSQLYYLRDHQFPHEMPQLAEYRGLLEAFATRGPAQERESHEDLFFVENAFKEQLGEDDALLDPQFMQTKIDEENKLRAAVAANPALEKQYGTAWDDMTKVMALRAKLDQQYQATNSFFFQQGLLGDAITLVRAAAERTKPNGERLPEFTDQALVGTQQYLFAPIPVFKDLQEMNLAYALTAIRRELGADDPYVHELLGAESPEQLAHRLVSTTKLDDPAVRKALYDGGQAAIDKSDDPMIVFARKIDPTLRANRKQYETEVQAPLRAASERIAKARFAAYGTTIDPDATFTARVSFGTVKGFTNARGQEVKPYTTMAGLFERASGAPPFKLPETWLNAKPSLDLATPMNLSSDNDVVGGNSGSPLINKNAQVVGLIFDGNIFSLGGTYGFDDATNRSVSLDSRAILEGLRKVYHLDRIVSEIQAAQK